MTRHHSSSVRITAALALLCLTATRLAPLPTTAPAPQPASTATTAHAPLVFEPNQGQADPSVDFVVHHGDTVTAFSGTSATTSVGNARVTMTLTGANAGSFVGRDELASKTNYFIGNNPSRWHTNVPNFGALLATNVYPGIDLRYYGAGSALEHDFIVNPGADYHQITLSLHGQDSASQDASGNLVLKAGERTLTLNAPATYQRLEHGQQTVASAFRLTGDTVTIAVTGAYDQTKPLIIDPTLVSSTYLGGSGDEFGRKIAVDSTGNIYVAGETKSVDFPASSPYQGAYGGGIEDAFVTKFDPTGSTLIYSTYLGGNGEDQAISLAIDGSGSAYVVGNAGSTDFPTASPYQASFAGGIWDAFLAKLSPAGNALDYSTYFGGSQIENGRMVAVDSSGNAYVNGTTQSSDLPTASAYQASNLNYPNPNAFLAKFDTTGSTLIFSTYLGGTDDTFGDGLAVDTSGNAYVSGFTKALDFPTSTPYQAANGGGWDLYASKFSSSGALTYSTYVGGAGDDYARGIAVDSGGNAYIIGHSASTNYPTTGVFQPANIGGFDAILTKLNASGSGLVYSTYLGGSADDQGLAVAVNASGEAYVAGLTGSTNFTTVLPYQSSLASADDAYVAKFAADGATALYSTYLGGSGEDIVFGITIGANGNAYLTGYTDSTDFPTAGAYQGTNAGGIDTFVTQISDASFMVTGVAEPILNFTIGSTTCDFGRFSATETKSCSHTMTAATNAANGYVISYVPTSTLTSGANTIDAMASQGASVLASEQLGFNLKANTAAGSFTASNFGANPVGGSGTAKTGYDIADQFKFNVGGDDIAESTVATNSTVYTVSFIANISYVTEPGIYTTPITYTIVPSF